VNKQGNYLARYSNQLERRTIKGSLLVWGNFHDKLAFNSINIIVYRITAVMTKQDYFDTTCEVSDYSSKSTITERFSQGPDARN